jgi:hypothetical protein
MLAVALVVFVGVVAGVVIATALAWPVTVIGADVPVPNALVQATVIVFVPLAMAIELVVALAEVTVPPTVAVRVQPPDGSVLPPSTV